ncbi:response regulator transcription factor [Sinirhodobacter sp. HNIBRBA609]|nr:response regulator transcription factor [Sinirhodobacter sp. HNIBRBA609]
MRILLVEDAPDLAEATQRQLSQSGFACDLAMTLREAEDCLDVQRYDAAVLDINLPDGSGTDLLRDIRRRKLPMPVLMLTAQFSVDDKLSAFGLGADDYLTKPFDHRELAARLHALLRRDKAERSGEVTLGRLSYNATGGVASVAGERLDLTRREFSLLGMLLKHRGQVVNKERLHEGLYSFDDAIVGVNAVELYIARLRKKLAGSGVEIRTLRGQGYSLDADD